MFSFFKKKPSNVSIDNLLILVRESEELLKRQSDSYNTIYSKASSLIVVAAIFIPLASSYLQKIDDSLTRFILFLLPLILIFMGVKLLVKTLKPVEISSGMDPDNYDAKLDESKEELLLYIIGTNRSCYKENQSSLDKLQKYFLSGVKYIFGGIALWLVLLFTNAIFSQIIDIINSRIFDLFRYGQECIK